MFDTLSSGGVAGTARTRGESLRIMQGELGDDFDPNLLATFGALMGPDSSI